MNLNEALNEGRKERYVSVGVKWSVIKAGPAIVCEDGYTVSVQASEHTYCTPRINNPDCSIYEAFELGFPSDADELINEYAEDPEKYTGTVYPYVPREVVEQLLEKHGGIKELAEMKP